jgi:hypothetical protein
MGTTKLSDPSINTHRITIKHTWINKEKSVKLSYLKALKGESTT